MYAGEMVEFAKVAEIFDHPRHPYTRGLISCVPKLGSDKESSALYPITGRVPAPDNRPKGCVFWPRCDHAKEKCREDRAKLRSIEGNGTKVRCHFFEEIDRTHCHPDEKKKPAVAVGNGEQATETILSLKGLKKYYRVSGNHLKDIIGLGEKRFVKALERSSFEVPKGQTLGIVGESGCGKSTLLKTIIGLERPTDGEARFLGFDIAGHISYRDQQLIRELQMVFQNPDSTMNPSYTVGQQIARPMLRFGIAEKSQIKEEVFKLLRAMRLGKKYYSRLPRQLSGGEKQRVGIARALACRPDLVLCDEPVSALDVSVQAAILNLLMDVQHEFGTTLIFISHDLSVVRFISDSVCVMYLGQIMEIGPADAIYRPPYHPYTEALLSAVPIPDPKAIQKRIRLAGTVPSAISPPNGCRFNTRCPRREYLTDTTLCESEPPWQENSNGHQICCHIPLKLLSEFEPVVKVAKAS